jgi:hypothetical protein
MNSAGTGAEKRKNSQNWSLLFHDWFSKFHPLPSPPPDSPENRRISPGMKLAAFGAMKDLLLLFGGLSATASLIVSFVVMASALAARLRQPDEQV